jgi:hypothetical protein
VTRVAIEAVRAAVGIDAVLGHYGHAPLRKGRARCPIHGGRNPQAFAVRDNDRFRCFNCGARGDVVDLERALGGGTIAEALTRLCRRHGIDVGRIDMAIVKRRRRRLQRLNAWWRTRMNEWATALVITEHAVRGWQCEPVAADDAWWDELASRCEARDRAEAMSETFTGLRTVEQRAKAHVAEQKGAVVLPWEAAE